LPRRTATMWFSQVWMAAALLSGISYVAFCMLPFVQAALHTGTV
jgi:hypothetical protein